MKKKKENDIELLISKLDKAQLCEFIKGECAGNKQFMQRFLALGAGSIFQPKSADYQARVMSIIKDYEGRYGYVEYRDTFKVNRAVCQILNEADVAISGGKWEVAVAILEGVAASGEDILNCGDDSAGELGGIVDECFYKWEELCSKELLPQKIKTEIFELAVGYFIDKHLKGWDWWWSWIHMAILLADTQEKQERIIKALDDVSNSQGDEWDVKYSRETAQRYKLKILSKSCTPEEQRKFMYENAENPDFRRKLLQMAWDEGEYEEVLRLAKEGVTHDLEYAGLVDEWRIWELKIYRKKNDNANTLTLARYFFFEGVRFGEKEYSRESLYALMKSIVTNENWNDFVDTLLKEASKKRDERNELYIYNQEKLWDRYMEYLRSASIRDIEKAPKEVWDLYKKDLIKLYTAGVKRFFQQASDRSSYKEGVVLLRKLIEYGGKAGADKIVAEQQARTPRRPALIEELSKL